jgi:hypothetical protein
MATADVCDIEQGNEQTIGMVVVHQCEQAVQQAVLVGEPSGYIALAKSVVMDAKPFGAMYEARACGACTRRHAWARACTQCCNFAVCVCGPFVLLW